MIVTRSRDVITRAWSMGLFRNSLLILCTQAVTSAVNRVLRMA